jgi:hypothetical protein
VRTFLRSQCTTRHVREAVQSADTLGNGANEVGARASEGEVQVTDNHKQTQGRRHGHRRWLAGQGAKRETSHKGGHHDRALPPCTPRRAARRT